MDRGRDRGIKEGKGRLGKWLGGGRDISRREGGRTLSGMEEVN